MYCASSSPLALSSRRMRPSRQDASTQFPSCDKAMAVTGAPSWSTSTQPILTSKRRTVPSTLLAMTSALQVRQAPHPRGALPACCPAWIPAMSEAGREATCLPGNCGLTGSHQSSGLPAGLLPSQDSLSVLVRAALLGASQALSGEKFHTWVLYALHLAETATVVTESANSFMVWMASKERERMSHTLTA